MLKNVRKYLTQIFIFVKKTYYPLFWPHYLAYILPTFCLLVSSWIFKVSRENAPNSWYFLGRAGANLSIGPMSDCLYVFETCPLGWEEIWIFIYLVGGAGTIFREENIRIWFRVCPVGISSCDLSIFSVLLLSILKKSDPERIDPLIFKKEQHFFYAQIYLRPFRSQNKRFARKPIIEFPALVLFFVTLKNLSLQKDSQKAPFIRTVSNFANHCIKIFRCLEEHEI